MERTRVRVRKPTLRIKDKDNAQQYYGSDSHQSSLITPMLRLHGKGQIRNNSTHDGASTAFIQYIVIVVENAVLCLATIH